MSKLKLSAPATPGPVIDMATRIVSVQRSRFLFFVVCVTHFPLTLRPGSARIGGPLIFASATAIVFGAYKNGSTASSLAALPEIAWEASLTVYLIAKGFKPAPILAQPPRQGSALDAR